MNILLVASKYLPEYTGAAYRLHNLYRGLCSEIPDWSVRVVAAGIEQDERADYECDGIPVHRIRSRAPRARTRLGRLARESLDAWEMSRYLKSTSCDVLHTVGGGPVVAAAIHYAKRKRIPLLVELVTDGAVPDTGLPFVGRFFLPDLRCGAAIVAISRPLAERCRQRGYERNVWLRPNPVDTKRLFPNRQARGGLRAKLTPFGDEDIVIAAVAKFMPQKNQIFLLDVLARLDPRFKLVLAGPIVAKGALAERDKDYFNRLMAKARTSGLESRLHVVPEFVAADQYIKASDVFAMPSHMEGLGTPLLEAQACGVPVIANRDVEAFGEHVEDGKTCFLRPLGAEEWADAVRAASVLDQSVLDRAARSISGRYSFDIMREKYRRLLEGLAIMDPGEELDVAALIGGTVDSV